jgi:hypothetical protein
MRLVGLAAALLAVVGLTIAAAFGAFGGGSGLVQGAPPPPSPAELRALGRLSLKVASLNGDPRPASAIVVPTTRRIAEEVSAGDDGEPNTPAYFLVLQGKFRAMDVPVPAGAAAPTGTILTLTIDPGSNTSSDFGLGHGRLPNLYAIGIPEPVPLPQGSG